VCVTVQKPFGYYSHEESPLSLSHPGEQAARRDPAEPTWSLGQGIAVFFNLGPGQFSSEIKSSRQAAGRFDPSSLPSACSLRNSPAAKGQSSAQTFHGSQKQS